MQKRNFLFPGLLSIHFFKNTSYISALIIGSFAIMSFAPMHVNSINTYTNPDSSKNVGSLFRANNENIQQGVFQLNAEMVPFVDDYIRRQTEAYSDMKIWAKPYFDIYDKVLAQYNVPVQLKYLSVIESDLRSGLVSWAGAVGPWQLMPDEAKRFGLKRKKGFDERTDYYKSTVVAAQLLKELYDQFQDWLLVVAAYNAGAGAVNRAIIKANSKDFYTLQYYLPAETRNHVKKFIATHYYFEGGAGWTTLTAAETEKYRSELISNEENKYKNILANTGSIEIRGKYISNIISKDLNIETTLFNRLNPGFDKILAEGKSYQLTLPQDKIELFKSTKSQILAESVQALFSSVMNDEQTTAK